MSPSSSPAPLRTTRVVLPGIVDPSGLRVEEAAVDHPGRGRVLVRVEATGVSYAEQSMRLGRYPGQPPFPFTPGYDLVGRVVEVGPGGDASLVGRRVAVMTKTGAWSGYAVVRERDAIPVPEGVSPEQAEAVTVNGVTAWQMLHRTARVERGGTVLLFGASGGVGGILIQLAHHAGIRVIGAASPRHHDALRAAGVVPVDYADPDLARVVRELAPGGVDAVFDNIGGATTRLAWSLLAPAVRSSSTRSSASSGAPAASGRPSSAPSPRCSRGMPSPPAAAPRSTTCGPATPPGRDGSVRISSTTSGACSPSWPRGRSRRASPPASRSRMPGRPSPSRSHARSRAR
ncbi:Mycocerosic acid synthase [Clavibacter michiganensis]|uniref:Mycocerosic acid synthase n=1 Tax=Clavibacter michiganensis TaxID=28447 RepID=A0A251XQ22_9MICO|nr:Mycocerosic acid synthase [Clavibacter michiganensis]